MENWTSCLRRYAGFPSCEEGPSDFVYDGDMTSLKTFFKLNGSENWKRVYIEVKSTGHSSRDRFHLSSSQFDKVSSFKNIAEIL
jgi:hypothetical protein